MNTFGTKPGLLLHLQDLVADVLGEVFELRDRVAADRVRHARLYQQVFTAEAQRCTDAEETACKASLDAALPRRLRQADARVATALPLQLLRAPLRLRVSVCQRTCDPSITLPSLGSVPRLEHDMPRSLVTSRSVSHCLGEAVGAGRTSHCKVITSFLSASWLTVRRARRISRMALDHLVDLRRMHEHALDLGGLVGAPHPALDAQVGAAARAAPGEKRGQIARAEADQRVLRGERGHHHFTDLALPPPARRCPGARSPGSRPRRRPSPRAPRSRRRSVPGRRCRTTGNPSIPRSASILRTGGRKASPPTEALRRLETSTFISSAFSSRIRRNDGVPA